MLWPQNRSQRHYRNGTDYHPPFDIVVQPRPSWRQPPRPWQQPQQPAFLERLDWVKCTDTSVHCLPVGAHFWQWDQDASGRQWVALYTCDAPRCRRVLGLVQDRQTGKARVLFVNYR